MEVQLTEYEYSRLKELNSTLEQLDSSVKEMLERLSRLKDFRLEIVGRRTELLEMLGEKYEFDYRLPVVLDEENKITITGGRSDGQRDAKTLGLTHQQANRNKGRLS